MNFGLCWSRPWTHVNNVFSGTGTDGQCGAMLRFGDFCFAVKLHQHIDDERNFVLGPLFLLKHITA